MPIEPPVLRAALSKAEAWSVLPGGTPSYDAAIIGRNTSGNPTPSSIRERAKNQKPRSPYTLVRSYIDSATTTAPATIRYLGWIFPDRPPTTNIITIVMRPPGDSTRPAQVAV